MHHLGVVVGGQLHVVHEDGTEAEVGAGAAYEIKPGHDAWVVGVEPFVAYEFDTTAAESYARCLVLNANSKPSAATCWRRLVVTRQVGGVPPAGFEPATHGLGNRCSIP